MLLLLLFWAALPRARTLSPGLNSTHDLGEGGLVYGDVGGVRLRSVVGGDGAREELTVSWVFLAMMRNDC